MILRQFLTILLAVLLLQLAVACVRQTPMYRDDSGILVRVNDEAITNAKYEHFFRKHSKQLDRDQERTILLGELINITLLVQHAKKLHVDREPDVGSELARMHSDVIVLLKGNSPPDLEKLHELIYQRDIFLSRAALRRHFASLGPISDSDVRERYDQLSQLADKFEYRARHILVRSQEEALTVLSSIQKGGKFGVLAQEKSIDRGTAKHQGELGWFNQDMVVSELFNALTAMKQGEVSKVPVRSIYGWHVIKLEEKRPRKMPSFDEAKKDVRQRISQERTEALVRSLKEKAIIKFYKQVQ